MDNLAFLHDLAGDWNGTNSLWLEPGDPPMESPATALVALVGRGKFVRIDYTWRYKDKPQEGSWLIGTGGEEIVAVWIDSWHMGHAMMQCRGSATPTGIDVHGSYAAPPGPDWGWRTVLGRDEDGALRMTMYNISPEGEEMLAVDVRHARGH